MSIDFIKNKKTICNYFIYAMRREYVAMGKKGFFLNNNLYIPILIFIFSVLRTVGKKIMKIQTKSFVIVSTIILLLSPFIGDELFVYR